MSVTSVLDILRMTKLVPHEELRSAGKLWKFNCDMVVIFVSHQWLGKKHPDADMKQFRVLQAGLRNIIAGNVNIGVCPFAVSAGHAPEPSLVRETARSLIDAFIWYDFFSVPQKSYSYQALMTDDMKRAVLSIPAYVDRSQYFLALVPSVDHNDSQQLCNRATWSDRGWCRTEAWVAALSPSCEQKVCIALMEDQIMLEFLPLQWLFSPPHEGKFQVETDRVVLKELESEVFENHLEAARRKGTRCYSRFLYGMRAHINHHRDLQKDLPKWLLSLGFSDAHDMGEDGWGPLSFASLEGNTKIMRELIAQGAPVNSATKTSVHQIMVEAGMTPLMLAAMFIWDEGRRARACQTLLELSADPLATDANGNTALHLTSWSAAGRSTIQVLLNHGASVNATNEAGETPLFTACFRNPTTSSEAAPCICGLLHRGASFDVYNQWGWAPLHVICFLGSAADIKILLEAHADVDQCTIETPALSGLANECMTAWGRGGINKMMRDIFCELGAGTTPLMMACILKNEAGGQELLRQCADPQKKSGSGKTALDIALLRGLSLSGEFMAQLVERSAPGRQQQRAPAHSLFGELSPRSRLGPLPNLKGPSGLTAGEVKVRSASSRSL